MSDENNNTSDNRKKYEDNVEYAWRPVVQKTSFRYSIKFTQSVTSGMIAFHGDLNFDSLPEFDGSILVDLMKIQETAFTDAGYKCASTIPEDMMKKLAEKNKDKANIK